MKFRVEFRPEASADVAGAFSYYEGQERGLGAAFEVELDHTVRLLEDRARAGPVAIPGLGRRERGA